MKNQNFAGSRNSRPLLISRPTLHRRIVGYTPFRCSSVILSFFRYYIHISKHGRVHHATSDPSFSSHSKCFLRLLQPPVPSPEPEPSKAAALPRPYCSFHPKYLVSPSLRGHKACFAANAIAKTKHIDPTTIYEIPKKSFFPPNQETVDRTVCHIRRQR